MVTLLTTILFGLLTFAMLSIINAVLAYFLHLQAGDFEWNKLIEFMKKRVAVCVGVWFLFSMMNVLVVWLTERFGYVMPAFSFGAMSVIINTFSALLIALLGAKIIDKISKLRGNTGFIPS